MPLRLVTLTDEPVEPGADLHSKDGDVFRLKRVEDDGAGSAFLVVRRDGEKTDERFRPHYFRLRLA